MRTFAEWPGRVASLSGGAVMVLGVVVLIGWGVDAPHLKGVVFGWPQMSPLTALVLVLAGVGLWCSAAESGRWAVAVAGRKRAPVLSWVSRFCATLVVLIATLRLSDYLLGWDLDMDLLWFRRPASAVNPTRMAPATVVNFLLLGSALLLTRRPKFTGTFQFLLILSALIGWLGVSQYLYGGEPLLPFARMAVHTASALLVLCLGIACLRTDVGVMALLRSTTAGGVVARQLVPSVLLFPILMGWLRLQGQRAGWFGTEAGVSLFALGNMVVFGVLVWVSASRLHRNDIQRGRAEQTQREGQQLLQAIIDNSQAVIYVKDLAGRYLLVNRRYKEIFHLHGDAILGKTDHELFPKAAADVFRSIDQRVAALNHALTEEESVPQDDGLHAYISVKCPLRDGMGKAYAVFGISTDITDRKRAEQRLQAQHDRLDLLNHIARAIDERQDLSSIFQVVVHSLEDKFPIEFGCICLYHRQSELTVISVSAKSRPLARQLEMSEQSDIPIDNDGLARCLRGEFVYEPDTSAVVMPFPQRLARHGLCSLVLAPLFVENKVFGVLVAARREARSFSSPDCGFLQQLSQHVALAAHQVQIHSALQQAYEELRQTQGAVMQQERLRALGQMASGIAHDINNAISPVAMYTQSLLESEANLSVQARKYLQIIGRSIDDVAVTVGRMREFYREREPQMTLTPVDVNTLVQQVADLTRARWSDMPQQRGIVVELRIEATQNLPLIMGVESEIREALTNLIFNAVDAMPKGGTLTMRTKADKTVQDSVETSQPNVVHVDVVDTGVGMDEYTRQRCLEPFFSTKGERGTGLGLAMVYGMVRRHSARVEIDSTVGQGTTMRLTFDVPTMVIAAPVPDLQTAVPPVLRILIVDDDPLLAESLCEILRTDGHGVEVAEGGQAGIDAFKAAQACHQPFTMVITDLGMPYVDGSKVALGIKTTSPSTPVILLTGWGQRMVEDGETPPHVDRVLSKPPKLRELRQVLAELAVK
jgi:PAS domain S-box-containing protein